MQQFCSVSGLRQWQMKSRDLTSIDARDPSTIVRQIFAQIKSNGRQSRKGPRTSSGPLSDAPEISTDRPRVAQWTQAKWIVSRAETVCRQTGPAGSLSVYRRNARYRSIAGTNRPRLAVCGQRTRTRTADPQPVQKFLETPVYSGRLNIYGANAPRG